MLTYWYTILHPFLFLFAYISFQSISARAMPANSLQCLFGLALEWLHVWSCLVHSRGIRQSGHDRWGVCRSWCHWRRGELLLSQLVGDIHDDSQWSRGQGRRSLSRWQSQHRCSEPTCNYSRSNESTCSYPRTDRSSCGHSWTNQCTCSYPRTDRSSCGHS